MSSTPHDPVAVSPALDRRTFVKAVFAAGAGLALGAGFASAQATTSAPRRRYAIVGTGGRHQMYHNAILSTHQEHAELLGLCDINPGRLELSRSRAAERARIRRHARRRILKR